MSEGLKRLDVGDQQLVDFIMENPHMSESACVEACGWATGSIGKVLERVRPMIDARKMEISKSVSERVTITKTQIVNRYWELANLEPAETRGTISGQVSALDSMVEILGYGQAKSGILEGVKKNMEDNSVEVYRAQWASGSRH